MGDRIKLDDVRNQKGNLINSQSVLDLLQMGYFGKELYMKIYELPPVTPQKVIRCKDCKYVWKEDGWDNLYCNRVKVSGSFAVEKDGFCAWAKMEESEGNDGSIDLHTRR